MHEEKPTFKDLLRKHNIVLGAVAAQAGVEIRIAYKMEQGEVIHGVYADRLLEALSHLAGQMYTCENIGGIYLHKEYHDGPYLP
ncbi:MAG: hypothetical protein ACJ797_02085 [Ktedonobacteraceae bacterium]